MKPLTNAEKSSRLKRTWLLALCLMLVVSLVAGCTQPAPAPAADEEPAPAQQTTAQGYTPGTYTAEATGHSGPVVVEVTFSETAITEIAIVSQAETAGLGDAALERVKDQILEGQTLAADVVSGATISSQAMLAAVEAAVLQADGDVSALKAAAVVRPGDGVVEELAADVVVIGGGASGVSAAIVAAEEGASVILLEKTGVIGGASNLSWAGKFFNSTIALENELEVDLEAAITHWIEDSHWRVDAAVIRRYVTQSGETYDWLKERGYETMFLNFFNEQMHMLPPYDTREETLRSMLAASVEQQGGQVITETTAKSLITSENGDVTGVVAEQADGTTLEITAKSVVLATGGYAANREMVKEHFGFEGVNGGLGQNVGEGLQMAWEAGARVPDNFGGQMLHQTLARGTADLKTVYEPFEASYPLMLTYLPTLMNVGTSGARFRDEAATLKAVAAANTSAFHGPFHYVIVSATQLDALESTGMSGIQAPRLPGMPPEFYASFAEQFTLENPWENVYEVFDTMVEQGNGFKGETIEALAENAGMDVTVFTETFRHYEEAAESGTDSAFGKASEYLLPMGSEGPYYAIIAEINNLGSIGGLTINRNFQVLNEARVPIGGLYAVGMEAAGVLYNDTYVGNGVGIGYAFTSGRLGGEEAGKWAMGR
ncbi:FAD-dependent oxidoreductase [Anoxynatronum buryatiense]|uniref:Urocanate reductase n=1 Tax=Anoxynatronum buryatiense TaxID=489973 RepID=A0AA46AIS5_9CLOT|nr:FAD-dependent oxidoreductase [Anoxynatronum buryatiense]SMP54148.1 fumarate reductase flavoprotein subunit [Anoxynatronum buryatiense]